MNQAALFGRGDADRRPQVGALVPRLLVALDGRGWVTSRTLSSELGADDRAIREAAHQSEGRILGGQHGYCLTVQASLTDVQRVTRWMLSQSNRMRERVAAIDRVRHGRAPQ